MTGFNEIARETRCKCPRCNAALELEEVGQQFFQRILARLKAGERVQISGFGAFEAKPVKEREIHAFGESRTMEARVVIRFKASEIAKAYVNGRQPRERTDRVVPKKRAKKRSGKKKAS